MSCNCEQIKWGTLLCALLDVRFSVARTHSWVKRVDWFVLGGFFQSHLFKKSVKQRGLSQRSKKHTKASTMLDSQLFYDWWSHNHIKLITTSPRAMTFSNPPQLASFLFACCRSHVVTHTYFGLLELRLMARKGQSSLVIHFYMERDHTHLLPAANSLD